MPVSKTKKDRNRAVANSAGVAEQLKQQIFSPLSPPPPAAAPDFTAAAVVTAAPVPRGRGGRGGVVAAFAPPPSTADLLKQQQQQKQDNNDDDDEEEDEEEDDFEARYLVSRSGATAAAAAAADDARDEYDDLIVDKQLRSGFAANDDNVYRGVGGSGTSNSNSNAANGTSNTKSSQNKQQQQQQQQREGVAGGGTVSNNANREKDSSERATTENVLDPRTRLILHKMVNSQILERVHGCVSTGKEANVYLAVLGRAAQGIWEASHNMDTPAAAGAMPLLLDNDNNGDNDGDGESEVSGITGKRTAKQPASRHSANHHPAHYLATTDASKQQQQQQQTQPQPQQQEDDGIDEVSRSAPSKPSTTTTTGNAAAAVSSSSAAAAAADLDHPFRAGAPLAIKIYKTSILVFKDREKYVAGEYRFQRYCKSNPRKMVRTWAEKESRNLTRLHNGGVPCPRVFLLRQHLLALEFIGADGWPAPKLKDARLSVSAYEKCYVQVVVGMRKMFQNCRLVHGDLSEFNLLVFNGKVIFIDVSQSVEHDHPHSMDFLRRDIVNVHTFFRQKGVAFCMTHRELFDFITVPEANAPWSSSKSKSSSSSAANKSAAGDDSGAAPPADAEEWVLSMRDAWRSRVLGGEDDDKFKRNEDQQQQQATSAKAATAAAKTTRTKSKKEADEDGIFLSVPVPRDLRDNNVASTLANPDVAPFLKNMLAVDPTTRTKKQQAAADDDDDDDENEEEEESDGSGSDDDNGEGGGHHRAAPAAAAAASSTANAPADLARILSNFDADCKSDAAFTDQPPEMLARIRQFLIDHSKGLVRLASMSKEERKLFQHAVKLDKKRGRQEKVPKHLKKRACKRHMK